MIFGLLFEKINMHYVIEPKCQICMHAKFCLVKCIFEHRSKFAIRKRIKIVLLQLCIIIQFSFMKLYDKLFFSFKIFFDAKSAVM